MVNNQLINKYAKALYQLALNNNVLNDVRDKLDLVYNLTKSIPELNYLLLSQRISKNDKKKVVNNVLGNIINSIEMELIIMLIENNDVLLLKEINKKFHHLVQLNSREINAVITSSSELSQQELNSIKDNISKKMGRKVVLIPQIDSQILGGIMLRSANMLIDNTLLNRLKTIKGNLITN